MKIINHDHYVKIHVWMYRNFGKADHCSKNKNHVSKTYEWANISGKYKQDVSDWMQMCPSCHRKYDYTEEQRNKIILRNKGNNYHSKRVMQYDSKGNLIKRWNSSQEAESFLNILSTSISNVIHGRAKMAGGWRWAH